jgi:hypothetical protein
VQHITRIVRAPLLAVGAMALSASVALAANGLSTATGNAAAAAGAGLAIAAGHVADIVSAGGAASTEALADAWAAANAGLDNAVEALDSNSTDQDAGGYEGISTARDAITAGLAHAGAGAGNAGDHPSKP